MQWEGSKQQQKWRRIYTARIHPCCNSMLIALERPQISSWLFLLLMVHAGHVCVAIIHWTLTRTKGSLLCPQMFMHVIAHGGVQTPKESLHWKLTPGRKSLATSRNWTCVSSTTVRCSNQPSYIPSLHSQTHEKTQLPQLLDLRADAVSYLCVLSGLLPVQLDPWKTGSLHAALIRCNSEFFWFVFIWRKLVAKSSVLPQRPSQWRNWWWWWWWWWWIVSLLSAKFRTLLCFPAEDNRVRSEQEDVEYHGSTHNVVADALQPNQHHQSLTGQ